MTVSSIAASYGRIVLDDLNWERRRYKPWGAYNQSKLANQLFTFELQRRLDAAGSGVRAVSAHPGVSATALMQTGNRLIDVSLIPLRRFAPGAANGALPTLHAATQALPGGVLIGPDARLGTRQMPQLVAPPRAATDADMARQLWELSAQLTRTDSALPGPAF